MTYRYSVRAQTYQFGDLKAVLAKATPARSGDYLAGVAAETYAERMAARMCLAGIPLSTFLEDLIIPYESDEVTRLILDTHDKQAFSEISHLTIGDFRDWLLSDIADSATLKRVAPGIATEMGVAVGKIMRNQDLILVAKKCHVITTFRNTIGLPGDISVRLQPNHPTDDARDIAASMLDDLLYGAGDAVIGINPATDSLPALMDLYYLVDDAINQYEIPTQSCNLTYVTNQIQLIERGVPLDLVFQSIAGTEKANKSFGIDIALLKEAQSAALSLNRGIVKNEFGSHKVIYFDTGQGSVLSANANFGVDQQTCEARAYAFARHLSPLLTNAVVGFIGPEYLYDGEQIIRAGLVDHFCGKLLGVPLGCDVCYSNHAGADQDDMDTLMKLLATAGLTFIMGIPGRMTLCSITRLARFTMPYIYVKYLA